MPTLTTTFTPPSPCLSTYYFDAIGASVLGPESGYASCFPSGWAQGSSNYFSPGVCPSGYVTACSSFNTLASGLETVITCCPRYGNSRFMLVVACSYCLNSISGYSCIISHTDSVFYQWWNTYSCGSPVSAGQLSTTIQEYSSSSLIGLFTPTGVGGVNAFSVQVRFQSSDFPTSTKTSATPPTVTVTTTAPSQPQGLSTGAQAGIGVAVAIVVLALLLLGAFLYFRRRRQRQPALTEPPRSDYDTHGLYTKPELEADDVPKNKPPAAEPQIAELDAQGETLRDTDEAVSRPKPEIRESSASRSVAAKDQEPRPRPAVSTGAVSTPDEPLASLPEDTAARDSGAADEEESEEELRRKIHRTKEERERLARIDELSRLEARLETKLAAKKRKEGDGGVPPI
jgi:LPXTG-motif cell wall-anchored protein